MTDPVALAFAAAAACTAAFLGLGFFLPGAQWFGKTLQHGDRSSKKISLTFDDGPNEPYTSHLLDLLSETGVPAAFFVVGLHARKHPSVVRRMAADGHIIGNHTYSHSSIAPLGNSSSEIMLTDKAIEEITGIRPVFLRPPYGHKTPWFLLSSRKTGHITVMWSLEVNDWSASIGREITNRVLRRIKGGDVILLHDGDGIHDGADRKPTIDATRSMIEELRKLGFTFVSLNELLAVPVKTSQQGHVTV